MQATRRTVLAGAGACLLGDALPARAEPAPIFLEDASRLDRTRVATHWIATPGSRATFLARLRAELKQAAADGRPLAVGAARHSMGGQSLPAADGAAITLDRGVCEIDRSSATLRILGGPRWRDVLRIVDPAGFSPTVMQSNNDFGVAGSISVNCHGWPVPHGPLASTVRRLDLMLADGTLATCSGSENAELFRLAAGGYGLFGVVVGLELALTPNLALRPHFETMPAAALGTGFAAALAADPEVRMAFGRLSVARDRMFEAAELVTFRPAPEPASGLPPLRDEGSLFAVAAWLYRAQVGSERAKALRWQAETLLAPAMWPASVTRNRLLNTPVALLAGRERDRTDILHEYFVPPARFAEFCLACREVIRASDQELLNVTVRWVEADRISRLAYAPEPRLGAVMAFSQRMTPAAEIAMRGLTERLIDRVLELGGSYYLPYRLHARPDQLEKAYPALAEVRAARRRYDPLGLFRNAFSARYRLD